MTHRNGRYHSLYPWHKEGSYEWLEDDMDKEMKPWVKLFNKYDLYTKENTKLDEALMRERYPPCRARAPAPSSSSCARCLPCEIVSEPSFVRTDPC